MNAQRTFHVATDDDFRELPERLRRLRHDPLVRAVVDVGVTVYTPRGLAAFLTSAIPAFGDRTGLDLLEAGQGERVLEALAADRDGLGY